MVDELNAVIGARYALTRRPRTGLTAPQRKLWLECKREETAKTKGGEIGGAREGQSARITQTPKVGRWWEGRKGGARCENAKTQGGEMGRRRGRERVERDEHM